MVALGEQAVGPHGETLDQIAVNAYPRAGHIQHLHTAGNSSGIVDGAGVVLLASEDYVKQHGIKPRARVRSMAVVGSEPLIMLTAPTPASRKALRAAGMQPGDIDLWEINEAFAVVAEKFIRDLHLDRDKVNVNGGAIALGHPIGCSGAFIATKALYELQRTGGRYALVTMCIGGGQGIAAIFERA